METATQTLHRLTSYSPDREWTDALDDPRIRRDFEPNDMALLPYFYKRYSPGLPRIALPRELPGTTAPALEVLAGTAGVPDAALDLPGLARLLYLSAGVVRTSERADYTHPFRAAGSAGGRFPLELYAAIPETGGAGSPTGLPSGVHWYDPEQHALVTIGPAPAGGAPAIIVTGVPWRTGWRYRERGYRHVYWDAGTMLSQLLALGDSAGLRPALFTEFPDAAVSALVGADQVHEWPVAVVSLGTGRPAIDPVGPTTSGDVDVAPREFPLVTSAQRAGDSTAPGHPWDQAGPVDPGTVPATAVPASVDAVIMTRGSQRRMDPSRGLPEQALRTCMALAMRGISVPHWVTVHDVTGVEPGLYAWPDLAVPVRAEPAAALRAELFRVALDQGLARDAAFVVISATDVAALSDREYRDAQLAAGLVEGRLHLAAYALGAGATGMTFLDSEIPGLLGAPLDALIFTCVGVPDNASRPAGPPGTPTAVRRVAPRD